MKAFKILFLLTLATSFVACQQEIKEEGLTIGDVSLSKAKPRQGDSLKIAYAKGEAIDNIILYYSTLNNYYLQDVPFTLKGDMAEANLQVPDSAVSIAIDVLNEYSSLNEPVSISIHSEEDELVPGALMGRAAYFQLTGKRFGHTIENDSILKLYETDLNLHPELKADQEMSLASAAIKADKEKGTSLFKEIESSIIASDSLEMDDYVKLQTIYNYLKDRKKSDSINAILVAQFPNSNQAIFNSYSTIQKIQDLEEREKATMDFAKKHPDHQAAMYLQSSLASIYAKEGDYEKFKELTREIEKAGTRASAMNSIAWSLAEKGEDLEEAAEISKSSLDIIEMEMEDPDWDPSFSTKKLTTMQLERSLNMYRDTYALILFKMGDVKEAIKYQELAAGLTSSGDVNERYIQFLIEDKQYTIAQEKASEFVANNVSTPKIREYLEIAFTENGNEGTYQDLIASLELEAKEKLKEELTEKMINEEAAGFTLKNIEGGEIALAELKGKTVILDFWATWCGPCKASFPGMQQALENYKDDENVVFLFIDTFERGTDEKRSELTGNFVDENNYTFTVLLDNMDEETNDFEVANAYEVSGIPTKFVIGPDGNIKFKSVGFSGSSDKLVNELEIMIELAQS